MSALFDVEPAPPAPKLSADRRRTRLQSERLAAGVHPLSGVAGRQIPLHDEAAPFDDRDAPGRRCGSCRHRQLLSSGGGVWPKCTVEDDRRVSHGAASDVRRWWPACIDHTTGDPAVSPDAARWIPGVPR